MGLPMMHLKLIDDVLLAQIMLFLSPLLIGLTAI